MNDDELRAFLDSATVGGEEDQSQEPEGSGAEPVAPTETPSAAPVPQRRGVPSFDELMSMGEPASDSSLPEATAPSASPEPARKTPTENAAASPVQQAKPDEQPWSQAFATDNEQLVPLILPGFSPEPRERRDLPPVFQAEPTQQAPQPDLSASKQYEEPAPTQPFDVLTSTETGKTQATTASAAANATAASTGAAVAAASAATAATTPVAAAFPPAAATRPTQAAADTDPFALLAPELASDAETEPEPDYERISVTGSENRGRKALPWLIVGGGVVVAIIASIFVVNGVRGNETPATTENPPATSQPTTEAPAETETPEPSEEPAPEPDAAPVVDPGSTWPLPIEQWGLTVQVSEKLGGSTPYTLFDGNTRATFDSIPVAAGFSDACAAAREPNVWGLLKTDDGKLEVVRPEPRCTSQADAALYDTIWGTLDYMAKSAKPS